MALVGDNDNGREYPYVGQGICRKSWYLTLNFPVNLKLLLFKKKKKKVKWHYSSYVFPLKDILGLKLRIHTTRKK